MHDTPRISSEGRRCSIHNLRSLHLQQAPDVIGNEPPLIAAADAVGELERCNTPDVRICLMCGPQDLPGGSRGTCEVSGVRLCLGSFSNSQPDLAVFYLQSCRFAEALEVCLGRSHFLAFVLEPVQ